MQKTKIIKAFLSVFSPSTLVVLVIGGIASLTNHAGFALKLTNIAFLLLSTATIFYILDLKNAKK